MAKNEELVLQSDNLILDSESGELHTLLNDIRKDFPAALLAGKTTKEDEDRILMTSLFFFQSFCC